MKRILQGALLIVAILAAGVVRAQVEFGAKAGVTFADVSANGINFGNDFLDPQMITGVTAGVFSEIPLGSGFYFAPEFNYTQKGFRIQESMTLDIFEIPVPIGAEAVTRMHYLEMPLAVKYKFGAGPVKGYVRAGPTVGYAMSGSVTTRLKSIIDIKIAEIKLDPQGDLYNAFEIGGVIGAGVEIPTQSGKFFIDASYAHGFTETFDVPVVDLRVKNRAIGVGIGYAFRF